MKNSLIENEQTLNPCGQKFVKRCPDKLIARNMQIKVTVRYHYTPIHLAKLKNYCCQECRGNVLSYIVAGFVKAIAFLENHMTISIKITTTQTVS